MHPVLLFLRRTRPALTLDFSGGVLDSRITFARASVGTRFNSAGLLETITSGNPRFDYSPTTLEFLNLLIEEARTNVVLHNRDLTNAVWTSTNCTPLKDQTGLDGVANSASSLAATAGNATCLQAITLASSARFQTVYIKRLTGSGVIEMTMDNGTTWTAVTVTAGWTRVSIPTQTLANPTVGFRIVSSGDAIAIDGVQNENGTFATSVLLTGAASVSRLPDTASLTGANFSSWFNPLQGTFVAEYVIRGRSATAGYVYSASDGTANELLSSFVTTGSHRIGYAFDGGVGQADLNSGATSVDVTYKSAFAYQANSFAASLNGAAPLTDTSGSLPTPDRLGIGSSNASTYFNGHIKSIRYFNTRRSNSDLVAMTV